MRRRIRRIRAAPTAIRAGMVAACANALWPEPGGAFAPARLGRSPAGAFSPFAPGAVVATVSKRRAELRLQRPEMSSARLTAERRAGRR